jgi:hypothetical protein
VLRAFVNAFKIPDLRNKILFTVFIIAVYRLGSHLPIPNVDFDVLASEVEQQARGGVLEFINLFSGGALTRLALFALGIMPYITSSFFMQLLTVPVGEPSLLRHPTGQRHLPALVAGLLPVLGEIPLRSPARGLPLAGGLASAHATTRALRTGSGAQVMKPHSLTSSTSTRWATLEIIPRISGRSSFTTEWRIRFSPRARIVSFWP